MLASRAQRLGRVALASTSPRRKEILEKAGVTFDVVAPAFEENLDKSKYTPAEYVIANAHGKALAVAALPAKYVTVIGSDTVVVADEGKRILEKPATREAAVAMLRSLSGGEHQVFSGVCIVRRRQQEPNDDAAAGNGRNSGSGGDGDIDEASDVSDLTIVEFHHETTVRFSTLSDADIDAYGMLCKCPCDVHLWYLHSAYAKLTSYVCAT
jgi:predicted house-cleaning NTP pyrophosphatase (Maf/HAM1 superfamily)